MHLGAMGFQNLKEKFRVWKELAKLWRKYGRYTVEMVCRKARHEQTLAGTGWVGVVDAGGGSRLSLASGKTLKHQLAYPTQPGFCGPF